MNWNYYSGAHRYYHVQSDEVVCANVGSSYVHDLLASLNPCLRCLVIGKGLKNIHLQVVLLQTLMKLMSPEFASNFILISIFSIIQLALIIPRTGMWSSVLERQPIWSFKMLLWMGCTSYQWSGLVRYGYFDGYGNTNWNCYCYRYVYFTACMDIADQHSWWMLLIWSCFAESIWLVMRCTFKQALRR